MVKRKILFIILGIIVLSIAIGIVYIFTPRKPADIVIDSSYVLPHLKDGDIILRKGDAAWSVIFGDVSLTDKRFSHLGIVRIYDGYLSIINSVGYLANRERGVEEVTLDNFLQPAKNIGVFRFKYADGSLISDNAVKYIGRPFDWSFDITDDSRIYCTELLHAVLESTAPEYRLTTLFVDGINKEIIPLDSISASDWFDEIFYIETDSNSKEKEK